MRSESAGDLKTTTALGRKVIKLPVGRIPPPQPIQRPHATRTRVISTLKNLALAHPACGILSHLTLADRTLLNLEAMGGQRSGKGMMRKVVDLAAVM